MCVCALQHVIGIHQLFFVTGTRWVKFSKRCQLMCIVHIALCAEVMWHIAARLGLAQQAVSSKGVSEGS